MKLNSLFLSPQQLKKYGVYAMLSFFMSLSVVIGSDDIKLRNADMTSDRQRMVELQKMLDSQTKLRNQQDSLFMIYHRYLDTTKHESH